jgi:micrococcal nuclease
MHLKNIETYTKNRRIISLQGKNPIKESSRLLREIMDKYIYRAKLERVVDGDTIDALIDVGFDIWVKKRIRYIGIDTWESRTKDLDEKKKGLAANARNKELLETVSAKAGYFRLKSYGVGKYGRVLGEIFIQDIEGKQYNINETLVSEGHGYVYNGGKKQVFKG